MVRVCCEWMADQSFGLRIYVSREKISMGVLSYETALLSLVNSL